MKKQFIEKNFQPDSLELIQIAEALFVEYARQGFDITLRQLYYQFVQRKLLPEKWRNDKGIINNKQAYDNLGTLIKNARLAGMLDLDMMVDRTREVERVHSWDDPEDIIDSCIRDFKIDKWATQEVRAEVWVEKEAMEGIVEKACENYDVPFLCCRGYTSLSAQWEAYKRLWHNYNNDQTTIIIHLGDHDPSGIDMSRDIEDRLELMLRGHSPFEFHRIALNMDQVEQYDPPPDPAKPTDSRFEGYRDIYGDEAWELDALQPQVIMDLITDTIEGITDEAAWNSALQLESQGVEDLEKAGEYVSTLHDED